MYGGYFPGLIILDVTSNNNNIVMDAGTTLLWIYGQQSLTYCMIIAILLWMQKKVQYVLHDDNSIIMDAKSTKSSAYSMTMIITMLLS